MKGVKWKDTLHTVLLNWIEISWQVDRL